MTISIFNTLSNRKEEFRPLAPPRVGMYVCGVTVYDMCHVGHARAYVTADVIFRYLNFRGYQVTYVRNFTDVDDKIIRRAGELGIPTRELSERYIREFYDDMDALFVRRPQVEPKVTEHIPEIVDMVRRLLERGHAYVVDGDVYFDVRSFPMYGRLSGRNLNDMKAGARVEVDERKRYALDFALWKASKSGEPAWDSPWGPGRPGWHIECSTMSSKYLGDTFDLHGGGKDLVFPHHENEIAQSEAATGKPFVKVFFHNGFVNIDKEKMSKSLGNFFTIREIRERYDPEALRLFILTTHYRSPINFEVQLCCPSCDGPLTSEAYQARACPGCGKAFEAEAGRRAVRFPALEEAQRRLVYLYETRARLNRALGSLATGMGEALRAQEIEALRAKFLDAMDDDFNAAAALAALSDAARLANEVLDNKAGQSETLVVSTAQRLQDLFGVFSEVLGLLERDPAAALDSLSRRALGARALDPAEIERMIGERNAARKRKDFKEADRIRDQLLQQGIELMDSPQGTRWRAKG
ncbi:MAG: cysteine--tRNA ligase [Myxococcales bacterium]|nr:cysteine--tRNA ligase [Myxococcales bacterium]